MKEGIRKLLKKIEYLFPVLLFLWATYVVFVPSSILLSNIDEFQMHYVFMLPSIIIVSVLVIGAAVILGVICGERIMPYYYTLIFSVTLCMYIQCNFMNPPFRVLDGVGIDWQKYSVLGIISTFVWVGGNSRNYDILPI